MAAFADHDTLDAEFQCRVADAHGNFAHGFVVAVEQAEVACLGGMRGQRPADAGSVEHFRVADQRLDVRFGEEIGRGRDQQHFSTLDVKRQFDRHTDVGFDVFFQTQQRVFQRRARQAEVVADFLHLAKNLVGVFLADADVVENLAARHGDLGGVDSIGTEHGTAAAFRTLVIVVVPVVEHILGQVFRAHQFGEQLPGRGEIPAVNLAHQVLTRNRHVFRIGGAQVVVALVGTGAAMHTGIEEHFQRTVFAQQIAHLLDGARLPVFTQFVRIAHEILHRLAGREGFHMRHHAFPQLGNFDGVLDFRNVKFSSSQLLVLYPF